MGHKIRIAANCAWAAATLATGALAVAILGQGTISSAASQESPFPPAGFFAGSYAVIGQHPNEGAAYAGAARIEAQGEDMLVIERTIDGAVIRETGLFTSLEPLADVFVLNILDENGIQVGSCLWTVDLDNYPRLTCLRAQAGVNPTVIGREALFPMQ